MKHRVLELLLLPVLLVGAVLAWRSGQERSRLSAQYERLTRIAGDLPIADPSKVYMQAMPTGEPLHFAWRVYLPPNYKQILRDKSGSGGTSWSSGSSEFIARVRIREEQSGVLYAYARFAGGSSRISFGDASLAKLLRERGSTIRVMQFGADELGVLDPNQSATLLRLTLPEDARNGLSPHAQSFVPVLYELNLGPEPPKP